MSFPSPLRFVPPLAGRETRLCPVGGLPLLEKLRRKTSGVPGHGLRPRAPGWRADLSERAGDSSLANTLIRRQKYKYYYN